MKDERKTKKQLFAELTKLRTQVAGLEGSKSDQPSKAVSAEMDDRFRLFYEQSPLGYQSLDEDGRILEVNPTWLGMLGYNHDEVIGKWFGDFLAVSYRDHFRDSFPKFKEAGEIHGVQFDMLRKDGQTFTAEHDGKIGYDECGNFKQTHCVMRDITQRKQTEEVLRQTVAEREKLEAIVNRSRAMVSLWRLQEGWPVEYVSDNVKQVLGYSANDLLSGRISWPGITHPDDLLELEAEVEKYLEEGVDEFTQEYRVTSKAGEIRWIRDRNKVLRDSDGTATHMQSILTDITEYKLAEKELRDMHGIVNKSSIVAYMCKADEDWTTEFISDNVHDVLGYSPEDFYSGRVGFSEIVYPDDFQRAKAEYERLVQDNEPDEIIIEYRLKSGSGEEIWIEDRSWAIRDANGKVAYLQGVDVDITERKRAEEEIESKSRTNQIILDAFPCVALLLRPQTREIVASNKMAVEVGAIPGKTCFETWFQRETPCPWCLAEKVWSDGKAQHCEPTSMGVTWDVYWIPVSDDVYMHFAFDITDRKKAEQALTESEERLKLVLESAEDLIVMQDLEGRYLYYNAAPQFGLQASDVLGKTPFDFHDQAAAKKIVERIRKVAAGGESLVSENQVDWNGEQLWFLDQMSPVTDAGGNVVAVVTFSRNITERKRGDQALRESEEKYRLLFATESDAILVFEAETFQIIDVNEAAIDLYGYSRDEFLNLKITDISAEVEKTIDCISRVRDGDMSRIPIRYHKKKDGTVFPVEISPGYFTLDNRKVLCGIYRDITARKLAEEALRDGEEKYRTLFETFSDAVFIIDQETGQILDVNNTATVIYGYNREEWLNMKNTDVSAEPDKTREATFKLPNHIPVRYHKKKDGTIFPVEMVVSSFMFKGRRVVIATSKDITERKRAEEALRESTEKVRTLYDSSSDAIMLLDEKGFFDCNDATLRLFGCTSREEFCSRHPADFSPPTQPDGTDSMSYARNNIAVALKEGNKRFEHLHRRLDGTDFPAEVLLDAMVLGGKKVLQARVYDITERKKVEEELLLKDKVFESSLSANSTSGVDGIINHANAAFVETWGYDSLGEIVGHPISYFFVNPDNALPILESLNKTGKWRGTYLAKRRDGSTFIAQGLASVITNEKGELTGYHSSVIDVTKRRKAEEALRASEEKHRSLTESIGIGISMISPQMEVLSINNQFKHWFPDVDISKRPLCYRVFNDPPRDEMCSYCPTIKTLKDGQVHEAVTETPAGGEIRRYRVISSPVRDADGRVVAAIEAVEDITDRIRLEDELHKADKLESVGILAGGIAHDFNNIMTAVFGNISLAKMEVEPGSEIEELLSEAEMAATRAKDLTHQLLTFSKGGSPVKETASIEEIIRDSSSFVLHGANVKCELSLNDDLRGVEVDVGQMSQVISNLVINADQAMPDGGVVAIKAENVSVGRKDPVPLKSGKYIKITVEDQGIGINKEHLGKIFDPFFTTKQKGSGLGLASTYSIIKRHDGHIEVASEVGVGTVFRIYLPATKKKKSQTAKGIGDESLIGTGRILIMDDEELVRKTAGMTLKRLGYEVDFAADGAEALVKYDEAMKSDQPFDAVILDLTIPGGMGGQECIKRLKALDPAVRAIVSSGYSNDLVVSNFSEYGFRGTANKPYKAKELGRAVQEILTAE